MKNGAKFLFLLIFVIFNFLVSSFAYAASENFEEMGINDVLDEVAREVEKNAKTWVEGLEKRAKYLFGALATISIVWTFGLMLLRKAEFGEIVTEIFKFCITIGFFYYLLTNASVISREIFLGTSGLANEITGVNFNVSSFLDVGIKLFANSIEGSGFFDKIFSPVRLFFSVVISGIAFVMMIMIAMNMTILIISSWIVLYAGIFVLGFGGSPWTREFAIAYIRKALALGVELMTFYLLIGIWSYFSMKLVDPEFNPVKSYSNLMFLIVLVLILYQLCNKVPSMVAGLISGGGSGGVGNGSFAQAAGALALAGGAIAKGANAAKDAIGKVGDAKDFASNVANGFKNAFSGGNDSSGSKSTKTNAQRMGTESQHTASVDPSDTGSGGKDSGGGKDSAGSNDSGGGGGSKSGGSADSGGSSGGGENSSGSNDSGGSSNDSGGGSESGDSSNDGGGGSESGDSSNDGGSSNSDGGDAASSSNSSSKLGSLTAGGVGGALMQAGLKATKAGVKTAKVGVKATKVGVKATRDSFRWAKGKYGLFSEGYTESQRKGNLRRAVNEARKEIKDKIHSGEWDKEKIVRKAHDAYVNKE